MGIGFLHTCMMGIFLATSTYLVSPIDFAGNPSILFATIARYKIKDTYATSQMLDHAIVHHATKASALHELRNLMIATDQRPRAEVYLKVRNAFSQSGLDKTAINTIYSHVLNPMVASRSYMCIEPVELYLDQVSLRRGLIVPVDPDQEPFALQLQDSGMVPVSTQISIVNPETNRLCLVGEYGEIWVQSEANAHSFYGSRDAFDAERFNGRTVDGDPAVRYVRTGDLGFLHNVSRPIGPGGNMVDMQVLFVLGAIGETFEVNGLQHFPMDVESSVERCHRAVVPGGCAIFQAGSLLVLVAEVRTRSFLASLVPVILNAVLNEHQLVLDIVAFVAHGDFPRSRLGEKQRGKVLANWVSRKMRTIAQFSIRDPNGENLGGPIPEESVRRQGSQSSHRTGSGTPKGAGTGASSLRQSESLVNMPLAEEPYDQSLDNLQVQTGPGFAEDASVYTRLEGGDDNTPTNETPRNLQLNDTLDYSPIDPRAFEQESAFKPYDEPRSHGQQAYELPSNDIPAALRPARRESPLPPAPLNTNNPPPVPRPIYDDDSPIDPTSPHALGSGTGGLRIANSTSPTGTQSDWGADAMKHMNLR